MEKIAALLIAAHFIGDFLLQPATLVERKREFKFLFLHSAIHGALAWIALQAWNWELPFAVLVTHLIIDGFKQRQQQETTATFVIDQCAHLAVLLGLAWIAHRTGARAVCPEPLYHFIIVIGGLAATVRGAGFLIACVTKRLVRENNLQVDGLQNGGKLIGQLERTLIFLLIFTGHAEGIGFLVAAKSILRFEEAKKQHIAEYVLIGTLLSFSLAIALTSVTKWALQFDE